jgi:hypothetical protein
MTGNPSPWRLWPPGGACTADASLRAGRGDTCCLLACCPEPLRQVDRDRRNRGFSGSNRAITMTPQAGGLERRAKSPYRKLFRNFASDLGRASDLTMMFCSWDGVLQAHGPLRVRDIVAPLDLANSLRPIQAFASGGLGLSPFPYQGRKPRVTEQEDGEARATHPRDEA